MKYHWPGNVRQLYNRLLRAATFAPGNRIELNDLDEDIRAAVGNAVFPTIDEVKAQHIRRTLEKTNWKIEPAAQLLGITRPTLYKAIEQYGLRKPSEQSDGRQSQNEV